MRLSPLDLAQLIVYILLGLAIILVTAHALVVLDGIEKRQQQSERHHEKLIIMADTALADHTRFLQEHDAMPGRLPSGR